MKFKNLILIVALVGTIFLVSGCGKKEEVKNNESSDEKQEEVVEKKLTIVNPESTSRPYAIMINNISVARQVQSGLQDAYIIYEMIVEGGITRYLALFMDQTTERIGTIRSARHYYIDYALENDAIYVHHGQSPQAQSDFKTLKVDRIAVSEASTGWRENPLKLSSEHTLYTSTEKLKNGLGNMRTTRNKDLLLNYVVDEIDMKDIAGAEVANNVAITYSNGTTSSYVYDAEHGYYLRSVNGKEHTDYVTKEQYHFKNIITYQVKNYTLDDGENKGRQDLENVGSGTGYYISGGYAIPIKWEKKSRSEQTKYTYEDGTELKVNDGNTFIQIQPKGQKLVIE